jgi:hypothetical protein
MLQYGDTESVCVLMLVATSAVQYSLCSVSVSLTLLCYFCDVHCCENYRSAWVLEATLLKVGYQRGKSATTANITTAKITFKTSRNTAAMLSQLHVVTCYT